MISILFLTIAASASLNAAWLAFGKSVLGSKAQPSMKAKPVRKLTFVA